jgi:hypothetical protein
LSTQSVKATVGNGQYARTYSDTATDGQWTGNVLLDDLASNNLGLTQAGQAVTHLPVQYEGGLCAWRIQSTQTLKVKRQGFGVKGSLHCWESNAVPAYTIQSDDILTVYPMAMSANPQQFNAMMLIQTGNGTEFFSASNVLDDTATALTSTESGQTLGDLFFGRTITGLWVCLEDGATLTEVEVFDEAGGEVWSTRGSVRLPTAGGLSAHYNLYAGGLGIPIRKGFTIKVTGVAGA